MATKLLPPIHPGEILREEFMLPLELSSHALARAIGVTPARVNDISKNPFRQRTFQLGRPRADLTKALELTGKPDDQCTQALHRQ